MPADTDKVANGYWPTYVQLADELGPHANCLEIGVQGGGGLRLLKTLFPYGRIVGVDHDPNSHWPEGTDRIVAEQTSPVLAQALDDAFGQFDLIIDDASHEAAKTKETFHRLWTVLAPSGFYVIEDWGVAFEGQAPMWDPQMLFFAQSLVNLFADPDISEVEEITFREGLIIIRKAL